MNIKILAVVAFIFLVAGYFAYNNYGNEYRDILIDEEFVFNCKLDGENTGLDRVFLMQSSKKSRKNRNYYSVARQLETKDFTDGVKTYVWDVGGVVRLTEKNIHIFESNTTYQAWNNFKEDAVTKETQPLFSIDRVTLRGSVWFGERPLRSLDLYSCEIEERDKYDQMIKKSKENIDEIRQI